MKIFLSGGGTLGPVVPLLAVVEACEKQGLKAEFVWVGTKNGPEKEIIEEKKLRFITLGAGKWRRYFSIWNIIDIFKIILAFFQSFSILISERPDLVVSCGGFVSVPLHYAAALLGIPSWVHQQDARIGLANRLMFPIATKITTALRDTSLNLNFRETEWLGNPSRDLSVANPSLSRSKFNIPEGAPVIFALGGGTGSMQINNLVAQAIASWPKWWHVIHLVGKDRPCQLAEDAAKAFENYHVYKFFTQEMKDAYAIADVVIARAGFSTITELAVLSKAAVIVPMLHTHQEENAKVFAQHGGLVMLASEENSTGLQLAQIVKELIENPNRRLALGEKLHKMLPSPIPVKIVQIIQELVS